MCACTPAFPAPTTLKALFILVPFATKNLCKFGFPLYFIRKKCRNCLNRSYDLRVALRYSVCHGISG